ncbi:hypothetical protein GCM10011495_06570 [Hymenobacter frigidus]|uniref:Tc toxin complex TcA C-terminal TcB-binding domain-containing protein n=1 Tax=Hymenobacter frigidus TaxID=1524095 RepID=A0ABQ1ZW22_9BACT|nr:hypothetical protein GCM10011495_06570 [Hymenobacter frigidus]
MANAASLTQLQLTLHNLSLHYIGNEFPECATLLTWLARLTEARNSVPIAPNGYIPMAFASAPAEVKAEEWRALDDRAQALVAQMRAGLNFYGYPINYVPLLSPEEYRDYLTQMFQLSLSIETSHDNYRRDVKDNAVRLQSVDNTLQANASIVDSLRQQVGGLDQQANSLKKTVTELDVTILRLADEIERAEEKFKSAIRREARANGGCPVGSILKLVAAVVVTVQTGGAAAPAIAASMSALETAQKFKDVVTRVKEIAAKIGEVQQSIAKLQQAYADFKQDIDQSLAATKLTMNSAEYQELFDKFKNMPEAKNYRRRIENYQTACNTRNEKLFEYTSLVVKRETLKAEVAMQDTQADRLRSVRARTTDPNLLEWQVYMEVQLARAKEQLVRTLHEASRAHEYWSLQPANLGSVNDGNIAALQARYQSLLVAQKNVKVAQGQREQPFSVDVELNELEMSKHYDRATGQLYITFALTPESGQFAENPSWRRILVRNVEVNIASLSTRGLKIDLVHGGSVQIDGDRTHYFSHKPRTTNIYYNDAGQLQTTANGSNLGGIDPATNSRTFVDLSPFAFWNLRVRSNDTIRESRIKRITLKFSGMYLPVV